MIDVSKIEKLADEIETEIKSQMGADLEIEMTAYVWANKSGHRKELIQDMVTQKWKKSECQGTVWFTVENNGNLSGKKDIRVFV